MIDFDRVIENVRDTGYNPLPELVRIAIPNAKSNLQRGISYFCKEKATWNDDYDKIADWLTNNKGKGLLLSGNCGLGKSLIGMRILPLLLNAYCKIVVKVCTAQELNTNPNDIIKSHITYIDDIGTEEVSNIYGNKRIPFAELVDAAERHGKLLMISTNLDDDHIKAKYGDRVLDRLHAITRKITICGNSMRR